MPFLQTNCSLSIILILSECYAELTDPTLNEEDINETQPWAKPLIQLWQSKLHNLQAEKEYNEVVSKMEPYCAICSLFFPYNQVSYYLIWNELC